MIYKKGKVEEKSKMTGREMLSGSMTLNTLSPSKNRPKHQSLKPRAGLVSCHLSIELDQLPTIQVAYAMLCAIH